MSEVGFLIKFIVDKLNGPPFNFTPALTLYSFDEQSSRELLQTLGTVLAKVDPKKFGDGSSDRRSASSSRKNRHQHHLGSISESKSSSSTKRGGKESSEKNPFHTIVCVDTDDPDLRAQELNKLLDLLSDVRYPEIAELKGKGGRSKDTGLTVAQYKEALFRGITEGDRVIIYPILHYLLKTFDQSKLRAYLAHYLKPIPIPDSLLRVNPKMKALHSTYLQYINGFKEIHKRLRDVETENAEIGNVDAAELRKHKDQVALEKQQLKEKISNLKEKTRSIDGFSRLLDVTSKLRQCQENEGKNFERMAILRAQIENHSVILRDHEKKLMEWEEITQRNAEDIFKHALKEHSQLENFVEIRLPAECKDLKMQIKQLGFALTEPPKTRHDVERLTEMLQEVTHRKEMLSRELEEYSAQNADSNISIFRNQVAIRKGKLEKQQIELDKVEQKYRGLENEKKLLQARIERSGGGAAGLLGQQFDEFAAKMRTNMAATQAKKQKLSALNTDNVILSRTEQLLKAEMKDLGEYMKEIESRKGVLGYTETETRLKDVSKTMTETNLAKGKTLAEISRIVTEMKLQLKLKKTKLQPRLLELKKIRKRHKEVEMAYIEKKEKYDIHFAGLEASATKLLTNCEKQKRICQDLETKYHLLNAMITVKNGELQMLENEENYNKKGSGSLSNVFNTYKDQFDSHIQQNKQKILSLNERRQNFSANSSSYEFQRKRFNELRKLLKLKLRVPSISGMGSADGSAINRFESEMMGGSDPNQFSRSANIMRIE